MLCYVSTTGIDEASESEEESEEEKQNEEEAKEEEEEEDGKKTPVQMEKKKKKGTGAEILDCLVRVHELQPMSGTLCTADSSGESDSSEDSDIEGETASALFMVGCVSVIGAQERSVPQLSSHLSFVLTVVEEAHTSQARRRAWLCRKLQDRQPPRDAVHRPCSHVQHTACCCQQVGARCLFHPPDAVAQSGETFTSGRQLHV